ncbi:cell wall-binding repeat-containing protein [Candidatus Poriferisodalis sp.]|uniref:cell wall-binding repeat-containing protein n=1 Tax=Candidatus Poriferisodalis sp. TaxID=3101277 RepID=UPI003B026F23
MSTTRPRRPIRWTAALAAAMTVASLLAIPGAGSQATGDVVGPGSVSPSQWPQSHLAAPHLEAWSNGVRIYGADRHQTALAAALTMRGRGGSPFDSPDATSGAGRSLGAAQDWWGLGLCPRSIIVVASDSAADALAAAALSDSTGRSSEPYLRRVAASDPLFDPIGGYSRVDTFAAPILLTESARSGARSLNHATRLAAHDLRQGGCNAARQAIVVGGKSAVPVEVETELVSIGYSEVFRVSGNTRYGTAAAVATSLGTAPIPDGVKECADDSASDGDATMTFYANSVVEWRPRARDCELLGRTVVLTNGVDALAAGWWTSFWQVPVLLADGTDRLPVETAAALSLLDAEHLIVLGGTGQIPEQVAALAANLSGAEMMRIAGPDRYATSVAMAQHFGGWWPSRIGKDFARSMVCLVASSGRGDSARGWPDALAAGAWCGAATAPSPLEHPPVVERMAGPVTAPRVGLVGAARRSATEPLAVGTAGPRRSAVPILLVPAGANELPSSVAEFLKRSFTARRLCVGTVSGLGARGAVDADAYGPALRDGDCFEPGFVVAFGGPSVIHPSLMAEASAVVSGGLIPAEVPDDPILVGAQTKDHTNPSRTVKAPDAPRGVGAFATRLPLDGLVHHRADADGPYFESDDEDEANPTSGSESGRVWLCFPRATYVGARWLVAETSWRESPVAVANLPELAWYGTDVDGVARTVGDGGPGCLASALPSGEPLAVRAVGPHGRTSRTTVLVADDYRRFWMALPVTVQARGRTGLAGIDDPTDGGITNWVFRSEESLNFLHLPPDREELTGAFLSVELVRGLGEEDPDRFTARWSLEGAQGTVTGTVAGEARLSNNEWELRGMSVLSGGTWLIDVYGADPQAPSSLGSSAAVAGLADGGYGAGGFVGTISLNNFGPEDDTATWQADAYINAAP